MCVAALARVLDLLPDAVLVIDASARLLWANDAAANLFGVKTREWFDRTGLDLVHPADLQLALSALDTVQE